MNDKELLLFKIYKDQPITREKFELIKKNNPDINFKRFKLNIINYQVEKYGTELKYTAYDLFANFANKDEANRINKNASRRKNSRFKAKEWH